MESADVTLMFRSIKIAVYKKKRINNDNKLIYEDILASFSLSRPLAVFTLARAASRPSL